MDTSKTAGQLADDQNEAIIQSKGLNAPRLTPLEIEATIVNIAFQQFGDTLTVCVLTLRNGTQVVGQSARASPENFDADIGKDLAFDNAKRQIWQLEGYLLRQRLYEQQETIRIASVKEEHVSDWLDRLRSEHRDVRAKLWKLQEFLDGEQFKSLPSAAQVLMQQQAVAMTTYREVLAARIHLFTGEMP